MQQGVTEEEFHIVKIQFCIVISVKDRYCYQEEEEEK